MAFLSFLNPVRDVQRTMDFLRPVARVPGQIVHLASDVGHLASGDVKGIAAKVTGNQQALSNARQELRQPLKEVAGIPQAIPRGIVQLGQSFRPGASNQPVVPTNRFSRDLLGDQPVQSIQSEFKQAKAAGKSTSEALGGATLSFLSDVAITKPAAGKAIETGTKAGKAVAKFDAAQNQIGAIGRDVTQPNPKPIPPPSPAEPPAAQPTSVAAPPTPGQGSALDELKGRLKTTSQAVDEATPKTGVKAKVSQALGKVNVQAFDRQAPILRLQNQVEQATGTKLPIQSRPYDLMRLHAGLPEATHQAVTVLDDSLKNAKRAGVDINDINAYGVAQRIINDRQNIGNTVSPERAQQAVDEITQKYTPEQQVALQDTYKTFVDHNAQLLNGLHDSGLIGDNAYKAIQENNQNYFSPFQVVHHIINDLETGGQKFGRSASFNVAKQDLIKSQTGMKEGAQLINPIEATITNTERVMNTISKNNVGNALGGLGDAAPDIVRPIKNDSEIPKGYGKISYFKQGVKQDVAIPQELADVYQGLGKNQADLVSGFIGSTSRILKASATSLSLPFLLIKNPTRDIKTAALQTEQGGVATLGKNWVKGLVEGMKGSFGFKSELYDSWTRNQGSGVGLYRDSTQVAQNLIHKYTDTTGQKFGRLIKSPADLIDFLSTPLRKVGQAIEAAPRLAEYRGALERGLSPAEAALASRNVTVDFAKAGNAGQIANMWIPFLNANLQGAERTVNAFRKNPGRALAVYTGLTALPILATYAYNYTNHRDVLNQIPQEVRDNNFIVILGDAKDKNGNFTQVLKIPKNQIDQVLGNPLEEFAKFLSHNDPKSLQQILLETASNASPEGFVNQGQASASRLLAGLPPALRVPIENVTNQNFYSGSKIVPDALAGLPSSEQYKSTNAPVYAPQYSQTQDTSPLSFLLGKLTGQSPLKAENFLRGFTSNLTTANPIAGVQNTVRGTKGTQATNVYYQTLKNTTKLRASASAKINDAIAKGDLEGAQKIASDYNQELIRQFLPWARKYGQYLTPDLATSFDSQPINLTRGSIAQRQYNLKAKVQSRL